MSRESRPTCTRDTVCAAAEWPTADGETRVSSQARAGISGRCRRLCHRAAQAFVNWRLCAGRAPPSSRPRNAARLDSDRLLS